MTNQVHIQTKTDSFGTTHICLLCGDACAIGFRADDADIATNYKRFVWQHKTCGEIYAAKQAKEVAAKVEAAKAKVAEIMQSRHVAAVEVSLEETFGNVRIYSAITKDNGIPHLYRVRVEDSFESGEQITIAKCNCAGFGKYVKCRHVAAVAKVDSSKMKREIYTLELANYTAHKRYERMAA